MGGIGGVARRQDRVAEGRPAQKLPVEGGGEERRRIVLYGPAGGHYAAHPHLDQLGGQIGGQVRRQVAGRFVVVDMPQVAAVHKNQLRYRAHLPDLGRGQELVLADDHAADRGTFAWLAAAVARQRRMVFEHAVSGQVDNLVIPCEEFLEDGRPFCIGADQRGCGIVAILQGLDNFTGLLLGTGEVCEGGQGVAHHQGGPVAGHHDLLAEVFHQQLPQHAGLYGQRFFGMDGDVAPAPFLHHFPWIAGRGVIQHQDHIAPVRGVFLELVRDQHFE